jgi:Rieske Fe-S protein
MNERRRFLQVVSGGVAALGVGCTATVTTYGPPDQGSGAGGTGAGGSGTAGSGGGGSGAGGSGGSGTTGTASCQNTPAGTQIGMPSDYAAVGLHIVTNTGFLIGRDAGGLYALTALCTHQSCDMSATDSFGPFGKISGGNQDVTCLCHGSVFGPTGGVLHGPATKPLRAFALALGCDGHLYVNKAQVVATTVRLLA